MKGTVLDILTLIRDRRPRELLKAATGLGFWYQGMVKTPGEQVDTGEPPRRVGDGDWIPIDECLGLYDPKLSSITLFDQGIRDASAMLGCDTGDLCLIVRVHEFAHALVHLGSFGSSFEAAASAREAKNIQARADRLFAGIDPHLHEQLAQILTYHALRETATIPDWDVEVRERCLKLFDHLMEHQPPEYRVFDLMEVPRERILKSLDLIRDRALAADLKAWRDVVTW